MKKTKNHYQVAVIGGGPAGLMAAGRAAECGAKVVLIERNSQPGKKLLLTGKGRCNITNAQSETDKFIEKFGKNGKFLYPSLFHFGIEKTLYFFNSWGLETKVERGKRVFPARDLAGDVLEVLKKYLKKNQVTILNNSPVRKIIKSGKSIHELDLGRPITADRYILCTGGLSYPVTGSCGEGFRWAKDLGHTIIPTIPALVPIKLKGKWTHLLSNLNLKNVQISAWQRGKKKIEAFGEAQFFPYGIGGPIILDMSKEIGKLLTQAPVQLTVDFKPALDYSKLDSRLLREFQEYRNKFYKNCLDRLLPKALIPIIIEHSRIDPSRKVSTITRPERNVLLHLLKEFPMEVHSLLGFKRALITSGGVSLKEVNPKTLKSKLINNLYFAGEILDLDGPTGGYNLQVCWSTGHVAGENAAKELPSP